MTRAQLDKRPAEVSAMFDNVANRYDLLNDALSLGMDRRWRRVVARAVGAGAGQLVLDLAAGTGTSSRAFTASGARCIACDFSLGMLSVGARKPATGLRFVAGDALALPFADRTFDVVTISFGLRNVADTGQALAELLRVTSPGGRLVICEFSLAAGTPAQRVVRALPDIGVARHRQAAVGERGGLRLPGRVDQGVAATARTGGQDRRGRLVPGELAEPQPRCRRAARGEALRLVSTGYPA